MIKSLLFEKPVPGASSAEITAFETEFGIRLSSTLIEFFQRYNGGYPDSQNMFYPVPQEFEEFHKEYSSGWGGITIDGLYGLGKQVERCNIRRELTWIRENLSIRLVPISWDLVDDYVVLREEDLNGTVYRRDHEMWDPDAIKKPWLYLIASDLESFYNGLTAEPVLED